MRWRAIPITSLLPVYQSQTEVSKLNLERQRGGGRQTASLAASN